jgi:CRISPR-associated exonuclease Cas4
VIREENWDEDDPEPVMISALEHFAYCPRQCALIHLEQTFDENIFTLRGRQAHERADIPTMRHEAQGRVERALPLWSLRLGLIGRADVVEFPDGAPYPVEYKVGSRRDWVYEAIQVCAQGICLEEMFGHTVPSGAIYYIGSRARREVDFDAALRQAVEDCTHGVRRLMRDMTLPAAPNDHRCKKCSLLDACLPGVVVRPKRLSYYRSSLFADDPLLSADEL